MPFNIDDIDHRFAHHPPQDEVTIANHQAVRRVMAAVTKDIIRLMPTECREASLFITKMEEAMFWANAGIARHQDVMSDGS